MNNPVQRIRQFVTQNTLRVGIIGFLIGACTIVLILGGISMIFSVKNFRDGAIEYTSYEFDRITNDFLQVVNFNPREAIRLLEPAAVYNPDIFNRAEGYFMLAAAYTALGDTDNADKLYDEIINFMQDGISTADSQDFLASAYYQAFLAANYAGKDELAQQLYDEMLEVVPPLLNNLSNLRQNTEAYWFLFCAAYDQGEYTEMDIYYSEMKELITPQLYSLTDVQTIIDIYSMLTKAASTMNDTYQQITYYEKEISQLSSIVENLTYTPDIIRAHKAVATIEMKLGRPEIAAPHYKIVATYEPTSTNVYLLAMTYYNAGDLECAYKWFSELQRMDDSTSNYYQDIASQLIKSFEEMNLYCIPDKCCPFE